MKNNVDYLFPGLYPEQIKKGDDYEFVVTEEKHFALHERWQSHRVKLDITEHFQQATVKVKI